MTYEIKDAESGMSYIGRDDESIFRAMHKSGRSIFKGGCEGGGCGICKVKILEGEYVTFKIMSRRHVTEEEESQGIVLACCVKPSSNILLEKA